MMSQLRRSAALVSAALLVLVLLAGCQDEMERQLGQQTSTAIEKEYGVNNDPVLNAWISTLGHSQVGQSGRQDIPYHFRVLTTDMVNAFAAPYGYIYVTEGMLRFAQTEDELAFVVAHEVGHVAHRDSIDAFKNSILFNIGVALVGTQSETLGSVGGIGAGLLMLSYSRDNEHDADISGSTYSYAAGYDPAGSLAFFERLHRELEKDRPSSFEALFLTHPPTKDRLAAEKKRPELNLTDAAVASRLGRSYARRYAYGTACSFYKLALEKRPEAVFTRVCYGDALKGLGLRDAALTQYQTALQRDPQNQTATKAVAALQTPPLTQTASAPAEQTQAGALLAQTESADSGVTALESTVTVIHSAMRSSGLGDAARSAIGGMSAIGNQEGDLPDAAKPVFMAANSAVSDANETVFALEAADKSTAQTAALLRRDAVGLKQALQQVQAGQGVAGDLKTYARALRELQLASAEVRQVATEVRNAQPMVQTAAKSALDTVSLVSTMAKSTDPGRYLYTVKTSTEATAAKNTVAAAAVKKVKQATTNAEARALLAKLNLASFGATPEVREMYDGMTAYYCHVSPREVAALREQGLGFGDASFLIIAARARDVNAGSLLPLAQSPDSLIDGLRGQGFAMAGPVALLRFLSGAIDREVAARDKA